MLSTEGSEMDTNWVPSASVGIVASVVAWTLSWRINTVRSEERLEGIRKDLVELKDDFRTGIRDIKEDLRSSTSEIRSSSDTVSRLKSSQDVVNTVTAKGIEGLTDKLDKIESVVADHTSTLRLLTEVVMSRKSEQKP